jgi:excisionase family DNA binding protein
VSVPPEVEQAIDKRSSMAAIGNLNEFVKYQMGKGFEAGGGAAGAAGTAAELAVGFGLAQQMMREGFMSGHAAPTVIVPPIPAAGGGPAAGSGLPELLSPAEAAQALGVSEGDVMAVLESGELKGKKIGSAWRIPRAALTAYLSQ